MNEKILHALFGSKFERDLKVLLPQLRKINALETWALGLKDEDFPRQTEKFRFRLAQGETLDDLLPEAFALVREAARRTLGERPYDVQLLGGIVLHNGSIMEMKTGEGKTLSSVSAAYLNALPQKSVHMVTVNDYLAQRDADWMSPVYAFLGLTVGVIVANMDTEARIEAYKQDITYGTNNEFGFDFLRDNMKWDIKAKAQQTHYYCIIDEIDSILIDEARTPLIISGAVDDDTSKFVEVNGLVQFLVECEKDPETDDYPEEPVGDYKLDEKGKRILFTDQGMNHIEEILLKRKLITGSLFSEENFEYIHYFTQALKAHLLFNKDVAYVVQEGQVQIVDEFTGRILHGRRYSEGLHQAIEAKENIKVAKRNRTLATITFQNYFRMYDKISGMTGTADTEAKEFTKIYNIDVIVIPTNRPIARDDVDDVIYYNEEFKFEAIAAEVAAAHKRGQPVLLGTVSVDKSEALARILTKKGIRHEILNAKNHGREAMIIAEAGAKGSVTIATNMAGRGTDIKLGGNPEFRARKKAGTEASEEEYKKVYEKEYELWLKDYKEVCDAGGLYVIGSERHESRRIDNQLRGRSGRQGDPGKSQFYISLNDDLMRLFGGENFKSMMGKMGMDQGEPIYHKMVNRALERAQKKVEERNFDIRKHLLDYDDVLSKQREFIYAQRDEILKSDNLMDRVLNTALEITDLLLEEWEEGQKKGGDKVAVFNQLLEKLKDNFLYQPQSGTVSPSSDLAEIKEDVKSFLQNDLDKKIDVAGIARLNSFIKYDYLRNIDIRWQQHLETLEELREAVYLRSYAQKNPLVEYQREGFDIFDSLIDEIKTAIARKLFKIKIRKEPVGTRGPALRAGSNANHRRISMFPAKNQERKEAKPDKAQVVRSQPKVGRNDPCPCGSGKKYKQCCGR